MGKWDVNSIHLLAQHYIEVTGQLHTSTTLMPAPTEQEDGYCPKQAQMCESLAPDRNHIPVVEPTASF